MWANPRRAYFPGNSRKLSREPSSLTVLAVSRHPVWTLGFDDFHHWRRLLQPLMVLVFAPHQRLPLLLFPRPRRKGTATTNVMIPSVVLDLPWCDLGVLILLVVYESSSHVLDRGRRADPLTAVHRVPSHCHHTRCCDVLGPIPSSNAYSWPLFGADNVLFSLGCPKEEIFSGDGGKKMSRLFGIRRGRRRQELGRKSLPWNRVKLSCHHRHTHNEWPVYSILCLTLLVLASLYHRLSLSPSSHSPFFSWLDEGFLYRGGQK